MSPQGFGGFVMATLAGSLLKTYLLNGASNDMAVDGTTPVDFSYTVPAGKILRLSRIMIYLQSAGAMSSEKFGDLVALSNGVSIIVDGSTLVTWKDNIDILTTMFDAPGYANLGKETRTLGGRWTLSKETGDQVDVHAGKQVIARVSDNLSTLDHFRMTIGGRLVSEPS
jgi:hypothetical protein